MTNRDSQLIWEAYSSGGNAELNSIILEAKKEMEKGTGEPPVLDAEKQKQKDLFDRMTPLDKLQATLDIVGVSPELVGTGADAVNIVISLGRFLYNTLKGEKDEMKRHIINAGLSAISLIPFADVVKVLKLRTLARAGKAGKLVAQAGVKGLKSAKVAGVAAKGARALKSQAELQKTDPNLAQVAQQAQDPQSA
jgi:hypothetical protein